MAIVQVHFDRLDLDEAVVTELHGLLDGAERERAARFRFPEHRRRFIVRRARLRQLLGASAGRDPAELVFVEGDYGKPMLAGWDQCFSASHSGDAMMVAVCKLPVGCDIEQIKVDLDWRRLAERFFASGERAALSAMDDAAGRDAFFRVWSRKEAFVKAVGQGLSYPLESFEVSSGEQAVLLGGGEGWVMAGIDRPGFGCAVVASDNGAPVEIGEN